MSDTRQDGWYWTEPYEQYIMAKWDGSVWLIPDRLIVLPFNQVLEVLDRTI